MNIIMHTNKFVSTEQVLYEMDKLAYDYGLEKDDYNESAAAGMSEFDAMYWRVLCADLKALEGSRKQEGNK
jgi:hypothetical protein